MLRKRKLGERRASANRRRIFSGFECLETRRMMAVFTESELIAPFTPNDTLEQANLVDAITEPLEIRGAISVATISSGATGLTLQPENDFFRFHVQDPGLYQISLDRNSMTIPLVTVSIYRASDSTTPIETLTVSTLTGGVTLRLTEGEYLLKVTGSRYYATSNRGYTPYTLTVRQTSSDPGDGGAGNGSESEPNNMASTANSLGVIDNRISVTGKLTVARGGGNSRVGQLSRTPESDFFMFEVQQSGDFLGNLTLDRFAHSPLVRVFSESGALLASAEASPALSGTGIASLRGVLPIGRYIVEITGKTNTTGSNIEPNYVLTIERQSNQPAPLFDIEPNDTSSNARDLGLITEKVTVIGSIEFTRSQGNNRLAKLTRTPGSDYYRFTLNENRDVKFSIDLDRVEQRPVFRLLDAETLEVLRSIDINNSMGTAVVANLRAKSYLFQLTGYVNSLGSEVMPNYTVGVEPLALPTAGTIHEIEPNDLLVAAQNLGTIGEEIKVAGRIDVAIGNGNSTVGRLQRIPNSDFYRVEVEPGDSNDVRNIRFMVRMEQLAHWPSLTVYDSEQKTLGSVAVETSSGAQLSLQLTPGTYFVGITAPTNTSGSNVAPNYELSISPFAPATQILIDGEELESNDSFESANKIELENGYGELRGKLSVVKGLGNSPIGKRERTPNSDFFRFDAESQADYTFGLSLDRFQHSPILSVFDAEKQLLGEIALQNAGGANLRLTLQQGAYFVKVGSPSNNSGSDVEPNYTLTITSSPILPDVGEEAKGSEVEPNDSFSQANRLGILDSTLYVHGSIQTARSKGNSHLAEVTRSPNPDFFAFTTNKTDRLTIDFTTTRIPYALTVSLYNSNKQLIASVRLEESLKDRIDIDRASAGDYFLVIEGPNVVTGVNVSPSYSITLTSGEQLTDVYEPQNNQIATAPILPGQNRPLSAAIQAPSDRDFFRFELTAPGTSHDYIQLNHSSFVDLDLILNHISGSILRQQPSQEDKERISLEGLAPGWYVVEVSGYEGSMGSYAIIRFQSTFNTGTRVDRLEPNDSPEAATELGAIEGRQNIEDLTLHSNSNGDEVLSNSDFFAFSLLGTPNSNHSVLLTSIDSLSVFSFELYDTNNSLLRTAEASSTGKSISLADLPPGEYVLMVSTSDNANASHHYSLTFDTPIRKSGFGITYEIQGGWNSAPFEKVVNEAIQRWQKIIVGDLPDVRVPADLKQLEDSIQDALGTQFDLPETKLIDDLHLIIRVDPIDGTNNVLARATSVADRLDGRSFMGIVQVDVADVARAITIGSMQDTLIHEIGHILANPQRWGREGFMAYDLNGQIGFTGENALQEYRLLTGNPLEPTVPVQPGTSSRRPYMGHWDEETFQSELMTPYTSQSGDEPLSRVTIAQLADLGYRVDLTQADPFELPAKGDGEASGEFYVENSESDDDDSITPMIIEDNQSGFMLTYDYNSLFPNERTSDSLTRPQNVNDIAVPGMGIRYFSLKLSALNSIRLLSVTAQSHIDYDLELLDHNQHVVASTTADSRRIELEGFTRGDYTISIRNRSEDALFLDFKLAETLSEILHQNPSNRFDVDNDGFVTPLDVLFLVNLLNLSGTSIPVERITISPPYVNVNGDLHLDPLDVLEVVNVLNSVGANPEGEGESLSDFRNSSSLFGGKFANRRAEETERCLKTEKIQRHRSNGLIVNRPIPSSAMSGVFGVYLSPHSDIDDVEKIQSLEGLDDYFIQFERKSIEQLL